MRREDKKLEKIIKGGGNDKFEVKSSENTIWYLQVRFL